MDKRVFHRITSTFPVELEVKDPSTNVHSKIFGRTVNISEGGLGLSLERHLLPSTNFTIYINFSPHYFLVQAEGRVIWSKPLSNNDRFYCGTHFFDTQDVNKTTIRQAMNKIIDFKAVFWKESLIQFLTTTRDLIIPFMPSFIVKLLVGSGNFVFLAHALSLSDFARKYPFANRMSRRYLKIFSRNLWPIIGSKITGFRKRDGSNVSGWLVFCPLTPRMMMLKKNTARKKIVKACKFAEKLGAKVIGLGAFIPILTNDGSFLADKIKANIILGAVFSAVIATQNVFKVVDVIGINKATAKVAIVGAGGSVGSICSKMLANEFNEILLVDKNMGSLDKVIQEIKAVYPNNGKKILTSTQINDIKEADVIIAVTNVPGVVVRSAHLKSGTVVIDAAQPKNISAKIPKERKDVLVIESGIVEIDGLVTDFNLGLAKKNETFSCLAEVLLTVWMEQQPFYLNETDPFYAQKLWNLAKEAGIKLAEFRNRLGFINNREILRMKKLIEEKQESLNT